MRRKAKGKRQKYGRGFTTETRRHRGGEERVFGFPVHDTLRPATFMRLFAKRLLLLPFDFLLLTFKGLFKPVSYRTQIGVQSQGLLELGNRIIELSVLKEGYAKVGVR